MESRTLDNLILENEDFFFTGNLTIIGDVNITNGNIIIAGNLTLQGNVDIENGNIIVSNTLTFDTPNSIIVIAGGDISSLALLSNTDITIRDGDIWVKYLDLGYINFSYTSNIDSDGNIEVQETSYVGNVSCLNYFVSGDNCSNDINAIQDIYILGNNDSDSILCRDILIGGTCNLNRYDIVCKSFYCDDVINCSGISIG